MVSMIFYAKDGKKFLSEGACKRHNLKLFAKEKITQFNIDEDYEVPLLFIKDSDELKIFKEYLRYFYNAIDIYIPDETLFINKYILILQSEHSGIQLKILNNYKDEIIEQQNKLTSLLEKINEILLPSKMVEKSISAKRKGKK